MAWHGVVAWSPGLYVWLLPIAAVMSSMPLSAAAAAGMVLLFLLLSMLLLPPPLPSPGMLLWQWATNTYCMMWRLIRLCGFKLSKLALVPGLTCSTGRCWLGAAAGEQLVACPKDCCLPVWAAEGAAVDVHGYVHWHTLGVPS